MLINLNGAKNCITQIAILLAENLYGKSHTDFDKIASVLNERKTTAVDMRSCRLIVTKKIYRLYNKINNRETIFTDRNSQKRGNFRQFRKFRRDIFQNSDH